VRLEQPVRLLEAHDANVAGNDLTERLIHMQAQLLTQATKQSLISA